jgi:hypothetical protein
MSFSAFDKVSGVSSKVQRGMIDKNQGEVEYQRDLSITWGATRCLNLPHLRTAGFWPRSSLDQDYNTTFVYLG